MRLVRMVRADVIGVSLPPCFLEAEGWEVYCMAVK